MAQEHIIDYAEPGNRGSQIAKLDVNNGYVYDKAGNQIGRWSPADGEHTELLADYASELQRSMAIDAMGTVDKDRARALAREYAGEALATRDVGVGDVHIPSALPDYASGYKNEPPIADMYAPPLLVDKQVDDYYNFAKEDAFQRAGTVTSAAGGAVAEIAPRFSNAQFKTIERALGGFTTTQVEAASDSALRIKQATVRRIVNALTLEREIRVAALATASGTWDSSVVQTLGASAAWDGGASSDPIANLQTAEEISWGGLSGIIMSLPVWHVFLRNPAVQKYFTYKDSASGLPSIQQVREQFGLPPIYIGRMQYMTSLTAKSYVWGNNVVLMRQPAKMPPTDQEDVASAVTFRWKFSKARDGITTGGFTVREFYVQDRGSAGGMKAVVLHEDMEAQTSKYVGGLIVGAYQ